MAQGSDRFSYRILSQGGEKKLHVSVQQWLAGVKRERGVHVKEHQGTQYVLIASGMKPNPGYRLVLEGVRKDSGGAQIFVREVSPAQGVMVPQVVTYPYLILKVKGRLPQVLDATTGELICRGGPQR